MARIYLEDLDEETLARIAKDSPDIRKILEERTRASRQCEVTITKLENGDYQVVFTTPDYQKFLSFLTVGNLTSIGRLME